MAVSYDKLWVILNEREMMKTDLIEQRRLVPMQWRSLERTKMFVWVCWLRFVRLWIVN